ncbi:HEPN domain-containing protein [Candidatus Magnetomoraceae bacterium gMMP-15]
MIEKDKREALIQYRITQAKETISEVKLLFEHTKYRAAVNRIYYGVFYTLLALGNKYHFTTSKHGQLIGWFNKNFIKEGIFDRKYGKILRQAFKNRTQGDYDAFINFSKNDVLKQFEDMKDFISTVENHILKEEKDISNIGFK